MSTGGGKKILRVPQVIILELLAPHASTERMRLKPGLIPSGCAFLSVHEDHSSRSFDFTLQDESFPIVPAGTMLPVIPAVFVNPRGDERIEP